MERDGIGRTAPRAEGADAVGQAPLCLGVRRAAGDEVGSQRVAGGQRGIETGKALRAAQGVGVDDAVANFLGDQVTFHGSLFGLIERRGKGGSLGEQAEAHGCAPGCMAGPGIARLALEDLPLLPEHGGPVALCLGIGRHGMALQAGGEQERREQAAGNHGC